MGIFSSIMSKIFHHGAEAAPASAGGAAGAAPGQQAAPAGTSAPSAGSTPTGGSAPAGGAGSASGPVDVEAILNGMAAKAGQTLNWRESIVDLMKLLNLDSSLTARKELAGELNYTGDTSDSATMNIWLHKQVMKKLAENGGKVPDDLKA
jgi:hypothetical protein